MNTKSPHIFNNNSLAYALRNKTISQSLLNIINIDKDNCDDKTAQRSFNTCLAAAKDGAPYAMIMCSEFYATGWGVEKSLSESFAWIEKSAASGFAPGIFDLGLYYENGIYVNKDIHAALDLYESAITAGYGFSALHVAWIFHSGEIATRDIPRAIAYAERAFKLDEFSAAGAIGTWYEDDNNPLKDEKQALTWHKLGAEKGDPFASLRLSMAYAIGQLGLPVDEKLAGKYQEMSNQQMTRIEEAQKKTRVDM